MIEGKFINFVLYCLRVNSYKANKQTEQLNYIHINMNMSAEQKQNCT